MNPDFSTEKCSHCEDNDNNITNKMTEGLLCAMHCPNYLTGANILNPPNNAVKSNYLHFPDKETKALE